MIWGLLKSWYYGWMCLCRYVTVAVASKCSCDTEDRRTVMVEQPLIYSDINNRPCPRVTRGRIDGVRLIFLSICRHVPTLTVRCSTFLHHSLALDCLLLCDLCSEFPRSSEIMGQPDLGPKCAPNLTLWGFALVYSCVCTIAIACFAQISLRLCKKHFS